MSAVAITPAEVEKLIARRFEASDARSQAYKDGFAATLRRKLLGAPRPTNPYDAGTAESDAWWAGCDAARAEVEFREAAARCPL